MDKTLYYGDNLEILRHNILDNSIDLIYLDPPFNSSATYNLLFKSPKGVKSHAQIEAFEDTWHWGDQAELEFAEIIHGQNTNVAEMIQALRKFLGENDMMAYLTMMCNRLLEMWRVLKNTGSLYLHCDPTASHYLKIVLDGIFGKENFRNEIIWQRTRSAKGQSNFFGKTHDIILLYTKSDSFTYNQQYIPYRDDYVKSHYSNVEPDGRHYMLDNFTQAGPGPARIFGERGEIVPPNGKHWIWTQERINEGMENGRIVFTSGGMPRVKRYLNELKGEYMQDIWVDVPEVNSMADERLGYPTQKPLALLDRIITASSNPGDTVLDPFCGCGTAVHAAEKLRRKWIGIDVTHLAISLIEKRMKDTFPGIKLEVHGTPKDFDGAKDLALRDKYQFQWWACSLVEAQPFQGKKKGADSGIDGLIFFHEDKKTIGKIIVSVKGGEKVTVSMVRDLVGVVNREKAQIGLFITLQDKTKPMDVEATKAGYYTSPITGRSFQKIQILAIKGLMDGTDRPKYPDIGAGGLTFKQAPKDDASSAQKGLF